MDNKICNFCEMEINNTDSFITCSKCGKVYHKECWEVMGECQHAEDNQDEHSEVVVNNSVYDYIYCTTCGNKVNKNAVICPNCDVRVFDGAKVNVNDKVSNMNNQQNMVSPNYVDMIKHILLLLFTFGIYHIIWIYKTTEYTNQLKPSEERNSVVNVLLCLFIPFYTIFWYYKTAEIIYDCIDDNDSSFKTMVLVFSIFIPIVSSIFVQDKINKADVVTISSMPIASSTTNNSNFANQYTNYKNEFSNIEDIKKYKELLDIGAITQEEFDIKKREILGI